MHFFPISCPESSMPFFAQIGFLLPFCASGSLSLSFFLPLCVCLCACVCTRLHSVFMCACVHERVYFWCPSTHASVCVCRLCVCVLGLLEPFSHSVSTDLSLVLTQQGLVPSALFSKLSQGVKQEHITAKDGSMLSGLAQDKENVEMLA